MPSPGLRTYVEAVPGDPLPHGILSGCTTVITVTDPHELLGTQWRPLSCATAQATTWCPPDGTPVPAKIFDRPGVCTADPVTIYAGAECSAIGLTYAEAVEHATETVLMGEQRALEEWLLTTVLCEMGEDLTPEAGAVSVAQGVATLETWLSTEYGGTGVLHLPVGVGALLGCCNIVHTDTAGVARTLVGNCLVLGAGYTANVGPPDCTVAAPGEAWLYATSPIRVRRDAPEAVPPTDAASVDIRVNDREVVVESTFVVEIACCRAAAVRVTLC